MTPRRQRMLEDMSIRNFAQNTQLSYLQCPWGPCHVPIALAADTMLDERRLAGKWLRLANF